MRNRIHALATSVFCVFAVSAWAQPETHVFKRVGGLDLRADVFRPAAAGKRPCVFWLHGGALIMGQRGNLRAVQRDGYLSAGYVVVSPDYRLAPETKLADILDDVRDAYNGVHDRGPSLFGIDSSRIAVMGHSAGGYLALSTARFSPPPRAIVSFYGYGDIVADWYSKPDPFYSRQPAVTREDALAAVGSMPLSGTSGPNQRSRFYLFARQQGLWPELVSGWKASDARLTAYCPVRHVSGKHPPTLLLHGDADTDVPWQQSEEMAKRLKAASVAHEFALFPGAGHGFDGRADSPAAREAVRKVAEFLKRWIE